MDKAAPILLRLSLLVAVFGSAVLLVEYQHIGESAFCAAGSGCVAVHRWASVNVPRVSLPVFGLAANGALLLVALLARSRTQMVVVTAMAAAGAFGAIVLIVLQEFVIHAFCKWCMTVDGAVLVAAASAASIQHRILRDPSYAASLGALARRHRLAGAWIGGAVVAAALPVIWAQHPEPPVAPPAVAALAVPGKVTVVSFTDFECPFCREMHPVLHRLVDRSDGRMALVREMVPLPMHPGALPAAQAYVCTPEARRDEMADALYTSPVTQLSRAGVIAIAGTLHLDETEFERCLEAPATAARIERDTQLFRSTNGRGLPTTYIGAREVVGYDPRNAERLARQALAEPQVGLPLGWMFATLAALGTVLAALTARFLLSEREPSRDGTASRRGPG